MRLPIPHPKEILEIVAEKRLCILAVLRRSDSFLGTICLMMEIPQNFRLDVNIFLLFRILARHNEFYANTKALRGNQTNRGAHIQSCKTLFEVSSTASAGRPASVTLETGTVSHHGEVAALAAGLPDISHHARGLRRVHRRVPYPHNATGAN